MHTNAFDRTDNFGRIYKSFVRKLLAFGALEGDKPHQMHDAPDAWEPVEITNCVLEYSIPHRIDKLMDDTQANLPWAENHFQERVSGTPFNPPPSHISWPYARKGNEEHLINGKFSHTYPERMWPRFVHPYEGSSGRPGIRFRYGDLDDLVDLLVEHPHTRQAYLPIWFPEDLTAAREGHRVPCTIGYHFLLRDEKLNMTYFIRSCDLIRYFRDDVYMACRLVQWVCEQVMQRQADTDVKLEGPKFFAEPGTLTMHIVSLHCFVGDLDSLRRTHAVAGA